MNWNDIPRATRPANYASDVHMEDIPRWIEDHNTNGLYTLDMNPDFQRGHVWTEPQQIKFIEAVLAERAGNARNIYWNHPQWMRGFVGTLELIDGLQRLTAILRFLNNEIPAYGTLDKDFTGVRRLITFRMHVNNLATRKEVLQWYLEMNEGAIAHTKDELDRVKGLLVAEK